MATTRPLKKQAKMGVVLTRDITLAATKCNDWATSRNRLMLENDNGRRSGDIERGASESEHTSPRPFSINPRTLVAHNVSLYIILATVEQVEIMMPQKLLLYIILATTGPLKKQAKMGVVPTRDITLAATKCNDWGTSRNRLMLENDNGHRSGDVER